VASARESPTDTVLREVREELGIRIRVEALGGVYYQADHDAGEFIHFVFRCAAKAGEVLRADPSEISEFGWFDARSLPRPMKVTTAHRLADVLANRSRLQLVVLPRSDGSGF
jgi:ADP-ribose pyrophosphatase YjhB (NUDIX family)